MQRNSNSFGLRNTLSLVIIGLMVIAGLNYDRLMDAYALATYHPSAPVAAFEGRIALSTPAQATLYRAQPKFDSKASFNTDCNTQPHELELGCYYHGRIYVLTIDNPSLAPEMDVVSAHELLHAQWAKMSASEQAKLGKELERVYAGITDSDLRERMAGYAKSEPGEEDNELHSILGTEFAKLSPELEAHYAKYFPNRSQIVAAHSAYQSVFSTRRTELEAELSQIRAEKGRLSTINKQLDSYKASGNFLAYNALVPAQNKLVDDINSRITSYGTAVDEYNALSKSLDSQEITDTEAPAQ